MIASSAVRLQQDGQRSTGLPQLASEQADMGVLESDRVRARYVQQRERLAASDAHRSRSAKEGLSSSDHSDITLHTAKILREVADVIQAPAAAVANDGRIDARESAAIEKQIDEAVAALMALKPAVRAAAGLPAVASAPGVRSRRA